MDDFRVELSTTGPVVTVRAVGELDAATASTLDEVLRAIEIEGGASEIDVDFADVAFVDSSGLSVLVAAHKRTRARGQTLVVTNPTPSTRRLFAIAGLDVVLSIR